MARYHQTVDAKGNPIMRLCKASVRACPVGGDAIHHDFHDAESASLWNSAARQLKDGIYMGGLQDAAASGEAITERDYETSMERAFKFKRDFDKRGEEALLDPKNKYFLVNNAPADQLGTLLDKSDEITWDDIATINHRISLMPDGPDKNALQTDLIYKSHNAIVWKYQNEDDFAYEMMQDTGNSDPVYQREMKDLYKDTRRNLQKIVDDASSNPDPQVQEALESLRKSKESNSQFAQIKHDDIQKQKREKLERLHFVYESVDANGNRKNHVSPISAAGTLNPNMTPPAPAGGHRTAPPVPPAPAPSGGHRTAPPIPPAPAAATPFPPTNPFENNGRPTPPPPASRAYRKSQPAWNAATNQTRNMMNQCGGFIGAISNSANESQRWIQSYNKSLADYDQLIEGDTQRLNRSIRLRDQAMNELFGSANSPHSFRGRMRFVRSMVSNPRRAMQNLRDYRRESNNVIENSSRLDYSESSKRIFIRDHRSELTDEYTNIREMRRLMSAVQNNQARLQTMNDALNTGDPVPIRTHLPMSPEVYSTEYTDDPMTINSHIDGIRRQLSEAYDRFFDIQKNRQ